MEISVVIAAWSGPNPVLRCLESLQRLAEGDIREILVANCCGPELSRLVQQSYPGVLVVDVPSGASIARSRYAAIERSSGDIIAVLHERYQIGPDWARSLARAHQQPCEVVGGSVGPAKSLTCAGWAMFLSEYAHVAPPQDAGLLLEEDAKMLPGGNISYKREAFSLVNMAEALWELDFHASLYKRGARFMREPAMEAVFATPFTVPEYISERVRISRNYACLRASRLSGPVRLLTAVSRIALPAVILSRIARRLRGRVALGRFIRAVPWLLLFSGVQVVGEVAGYLSKAPFAAFAPNSNQERLAD